MTEAGPGQIWVCGACGRTAEKRDEFAEAACRTWAVLCYRKPDDNGKWVVVPGAPGFLSKEP